MNLRAGARGEQRLDVQLMVLMVLEDKWKEMKKNANNVDGFGANSMKYA